MRRSLLISIAAGGVGAAAFLLLLLTPGSFPNEEGTATWPRPASVVEADALSRLIRTPEAEGVPVLRPVPPESGLLVVPEALRPSVEFWKRIYTELYSFQALVHDSEKTSRIYGLVDLRDEPGVNSGNAHSVRSAARRVLGRYRDHLRYLTSSRYDAAKLKGERRRLYHLMRATGGLDAFERADKTVRIQRGLRDTLRSSIIRSGRYFAHYSEIFRESGLPLELVLLPHLESSFLYEARSSAGAVGIWQLTAAASSRLLHISSTVDERIDPWRSAEAAAVLLRENHRRLRSWPLAVTAYNQGLNAMLRAVRWNGSRDIEPIIRSYHGRTFGFVGRNFYCAFVAIVEVVRDYELYFGDLPIEPAVEIRRIALEKSAPLQTICGELGVQPGLIAPLNPALRRHAFNPSTRLPRGMVLNLPAEAEATN